MRRKLEPVTSRAARKAPTACGREIPAAPQVSTDSASRAGSCRAQRAIDKFWVPAGRLDDFNGHILGPIAVTASYAGDRPSRQTAGLRRAVPERQAAATAIVCALPHLGLRRGVAPRAVNVISVATARP
jgi:hypothetical protein